MCKDKKKILSKLEFAVFVVLLILMMLTAFIIAGLVKVNEWSVPISIDNWLIYYGTIFGALIGGYITAVGLYITNKQTREIQNENKKIQKMILRRQNSEKRDKIASSAFIIKNDLEMCFSDIFKILVRFSIENSKVIMSEEEKSKWMLAWKDIIRGFEFSSGWREDIRVISHELGKEKIEKLYSMYIMLEKSKDFGKIIKRNPLEYKDLYRNIELLPKEEIFENGFIGKYNDIRFDVDNYGDLYKKSKPMIILDSEKAEVLKLGICKKMRFFEEIVDKKKSCKLFLQKEWMEILELLDKIAN